MIKPTANYPKENGYPKEPSYNIAAWRWLRSHLHMWGVDISEFSTINDGDVICATTCMKVADAIEAHLDELEESDRHWIEKDIILWRTCGGFKQF
jgi:hypothetical protein